MPKLTTICNAIGVYELFTELVGTDVSTKAYAIVQHDRILLRECNMQLVIGTKLVARHTVSNAEVTGIIADRVKIKTKAGNVLTLPVSTLNKYYKV